MWIGCFIYLALLLILFVFYNTIKMRIIIISGTIHPHITPRAFRASELACSLSRLGHDVTIYAILGNYDYTEYEKIHNIKVCTLGTSSWGNPNSDGTNKRGIVSKAFEKLFSRIIDYPKTEYYFKVRRALMKESDFDYLITIAQPFPIHWAAASVRKKHPNKFKYWTADCGDPFVCNPNIKRFKPILVPIEKKWCRLVDTITVPVVGAVNGYFPEFKNKIKVIPQGIDFNSVELKEYKRNQIPTFLYSGGVIPIRRDPTLFLDYLVSIKDKEFRFIVYSNSPIFLQYKEQLKEHLDIRQYIPRLELLKEQSTMDFLINIQNNNPVQVPSKLIDYSLTKRPILNISSSFAESEKEAFNEFLHGDYTKQYIVANVEQYDSDHVANRFISLIKD